MSGKPAVFIQNRCDWNTNSIPTAEKLKELGLDLPEVVGVVEKATKN